MKPCNAMSAILPSSCAMKYNPIDTHFQRVFVKLTPA
jgi:hypothetical protein